MRGNGRFLSRRWKHDRRPAPRHGGSTCRGTAGGMKRAGLWLLAAAVLVTVAAPWLAPNPPDRRHPDSLYAPPTPIHVFDGAPRAPFIYPQQLVNPLERRFEKDTSRPAPLQWFTDGRLFTVSE